MCAFPVSFGLCFETNHRSSSACRREIDCLSALVTTWQISVAGQVCGRWRDQSARFIEACPSPRFAAHLTSTKKTGPKKNARLFSATTRNSYVHVLHERGYKCCTSISFLTSHVRINFIMYAPPDNYIDAGIRFFQQGGGHLRPSCLSVPVPVDLLVLIFANKFTLPTADKYTTMFSSSNGMVQAEQCLHVATKEPKTTANNDDEESSLIQLLIYQSPTHASQIHPSSSSPFEFEFTTLLLRCEVVGVWHPSLSMQSSHPQISPYIQHPTQKPRHASSHVRM